MGQWILSNYKVLGFYINIFYEEVLLSYIWMCIISMGPVLVKNMQTPHPLKKSRFHIFVQIVAQCSETNTKSIFRFLFMIDFVHIF